MCLKYTMGDYTPKITAAQPYYESLLMRKEYRLSKIRTWKYSYVSTIVITNIFVTKLQR